MVQCGKHHIVPQQRAISDGDAPLVLDFDARIEKYILSDLQILSAVGVKGRKE